MKIFEDKVCVITGAGSGIGRQLAISLSGIGAKVVISDKNRATLEETRLIIGSRQQDVCNLDVSEYQEVKAHLHETAERLGSIDYVFNNAGIAIAADARDYEMSHWEKVVQVNLMGVIYGTDVAYKIMTKQRRGHIINIASLSGLIPFPTNVPYATTKHGVVGLSRSLRVEGQALGVNVSVVCPGFVESNIYKASEYINTDSERFLNAPLPFKKVPTEVAVNKILMGVEKNKEVIVFPFSGVITWALFRVSASLIAGVTKGFIASFRKFREKA